jgi:glycosyltransferase involved in cell wall biosynthesis
MFGAATSGKGVCNENPNSNIHFVNLGANGAEENEVKEFIRNSKYKDRIHLIAGAIDRENELPALYSACYALVFPLLNEGFGLPIMEAMRCGVPTISSTTCFPDITNKETLLVDALSEESIADGMKKIVEDKDLYDKLVENGLKFAENFTWDKMGENLSREFKKIMK